MLGLVRSPDPRRGGSPIWLPLTPRPAEPAEPGSPGSRPRSQPLLSRCPQLQRVDQDATRQDHRPGAQRVLLCLWPGGPCLSGPSIPAEEPGGPHRLRVCGDPAPALEQGFWSSSPGDASPAVHPHPPPHTPWDPSLRAKETPICLVIFPLAPILFCFLFLFFPQETPPGCSLGPRRPRLRQCWPGVPSLAPSVLAPSTLTLRCDPSHI